MRSTFKVLFYLKRNKDKDQKVVPVMGRITVNGSIAQFSAKLSVPETQRRLRFLFCREAVEAVEAAFSGAAGGWPGGVPPGAAGTSLAAGLFLSAHLRFGIYHMPAEPICAPANCPGL